MKPQATTWLATAVFCCAAALNVTVVHARELTGVNLPDALSVAGHGLQLNGMGIGTKAFLKIYVIGLYLEAPTTSARAAMETDETKRVVLTMLRDVSRERFIQTLETSVIRNSGHATPSLRARLDQLENAIPDCKKGDVVDLTYVPNVGTVLHAHGKELTIPGKDFADALFSVWLGVKPSNFALQQQLMGVYNAPRLGL